MIELHLPWPPSKLSPNSRVHWAQRSKLAKQYRTECFRSARSAVQGMDLSDLQAQTAKGSIALFIDFCPPDRRHRDDDNVIASFKAGRDGIADALMVDDKLFRIHPFLRDVPAPGGQVVVRILKAPTE